MPSPHINQVAYEQDQEVARLLNEIIGKVTGLTPAFAEADKPRLHRLDEGNFEINLGSRYHDGIGDDMPRHYSAKIGMSRPDYESPGQPQTITVTFAAGAASHSATLPSQRLADFLKTHQIKAEFVRGNRDTAGNTTILFDNDLLMNLELAVKALEKAQGPASTKVLSSRAASSLERQ
jgi:hypothetical protein